ncbi:MAG: hypothetical protein ACJ8BW_29715 [Ktedonobacteraceae bacterium]|jgi:hypothetical protein
MYTQILSLCLGILGITGTLSLVAIAFILLWYYRGTRFWSFRWHYRNWRLRQLSAIACFFFLAMAASYGVLGQVWAWIYLIAAFKAGSWWLRCVISRRA